MHDDPIIEGDLLLSKSELDDELFSDDAVHGVVLLVDEDGNPFIRVDVEPGHRLAARDTGPIPIQLNQIPMRSVSPPEDSDEVSTLEFDARYNPIRPGARIQNPRRKLGTLGLVGVDISSGKPSILSNWHVMAGTGAKVGDPIYQPRPNQSIAKLMHGALPSENPFGYHVDAASSELFGNRSTSNIPLGLGEPPIIRTRAARRGQHVVKAGRTTEDTHGLIQSLLASVRINYDGRVETFRNQIEIKPHPMFPVPEISSGGDSGSVWLDEASHDAVGLHFAGETSGPDRAWASPIDQAMAAVDFRLGPATTGGVPAYRFWFGQGGISFRYDHWFKSDPVPIPGYSYEGEVFRWFNAAAPGRIGLYQWFSRTRFNHYYHLGPGQEFVPGTDYVFQNIAGYVSAGALPGMVQLWIGYNERNLDHLLTINRQELATNGYSGIFPYGFVYPPP